MPQVSPCVTASNGKTVGLSPIKRVVSVFILRTSENGCKQVALFRRCDTMPSFPSHYAAVSGSIEPSDASPLDAAARELDEETTICRDTLGAPSSSNDGVGQDRLKTILRQGLHIDVPMSRSGGCFRVYPFALKLPRGVEDFKMRGTEHDEMTFMPIDEFMESGAQFVPMLKRAFHHATFGSNIDLPKPIREWEGDRVNGAAHLARQAVTLADSHHGTQIDIGKHDMISAALSIAMLRPSMVPIVNAMLKFDNHARCEGAEAARIATLSSLDAEVTASVDLAVREVLNYIGKLKSDSSHREIVLGTFSRSSTLKSILGKVLDAVGQSAAPLTVLCSQSSPGEEGELMANDVAGAECVSDTAFLERIGLGKVHLVLIGADCITPREIANKVGTVTLVEACRRAGVPVYCCTDRSKLWDDVYPPSLESIFEVVPIKLIDRVLVPERSESGAY